MGYWKKDTGDDVEIYVDDEGNTFIFETGGLDHHEVEMETIVIEGDLFIIFPGCDMYEEGVRLKKTELGYFVIVENEEGAPYGFGILNAAEFAIRELVEEFDFFQEDMTVMKSWRFYGDRIGMGMFYFHSKETQEVIEYTEELYNARLNADITKNGRLKAIEFMESYYVYLHRYLFMQGN
ncbi:MAG: hypothetical protein EP319_00075 [Deltaproteobacteria bacterium]|nr:MAG: hypothetical protein EP319_00075 [Deltaproteobacteria bacterium]